MRNRIRVIMIGSATELYCSDSQLICNIDLCLLRISCLPHFPLLCEVEEWNLYLFIVFIWPLNLTGSTDLSSCNCYSRAIRLLQASVGCHDKCSLINERHFIFVSFGKEELSPSPFIFPRWGNVSWRSVRCSIFQGYRITYARCKV